MATYQFQTEVTQLLQLIIHSLYSHKEIFLRELVSNASDALDKLKYLTVTDEAFKSLAFEPRIDIAFDEAAKTLTISDSGIGMDEKDLTENLGTIARSGTRRFLENLKDEERKNSNLIGQFGVGFYSAFMVADRIEVTSRKAGADKTWKWISDGKGSYEIEAVAEGRTGQGTDILLHLNEEGLEYASRYQISDVVKKYSNHIAFPIWLSYDQDTWDDKGNKTGKEHKVEQLNSANALWARPKAEITEAEYKEFYKALSHEDDEPLHWVHTRAEGSQEYTTLFYFPSKAPFDLYYADYHPGVKLYVKRVFITDDEKELLPTYLRFVRGVIDSEDLPLNVSREILQQNRVLAAIRQASVKKILSELKSLSETSPAKYLDFVKEFNRPLKEGLYSDYGNREAILELVRFKSSSAEGFTSLAEYKGRMKEGQKAIYWLSGSDEKRLRSSPLLEAYLKEGIEVLLLDDEIDPIVMSGIDKYGEIELKSVSHAGAEADLGIKADAETEKQGKDAAEKIKKALGEAVKDVRVSSRLADSPSCVVADKDDPTYQMQEMLKAMGRSDFPAAKPVLEINPAHPLVKKAAEAEEAVVEDISRVLLDQALLVEGQSIADPADFVKRMNRLIG